MSAAARPIEDAWVQAALQPWIPFECLQIGRGSQVGDVQAVDLGPIQLVRERQRVGVQKLGSMPSDTCTVSCCSPDPTVRFSQFRTGAIDEVFFLGAATEFDVYVPPGAETRYVSLGQGTFLEALRALDPARWDRTAPLFVIEGARQRAFEAAFDRALELSQTTSGELERLGHALVNGLALLASQPTEGAPPPRERARGYHVCRRARAMLEESRDVPSVVDLCVATGVSRRTLEYAFREYAGLSPGAYLRRCRLGRARVALCEAEPHETTVTAVATDLGFFHLSRFARDYARMFGELPSTTLARSA